MPASPRTRHRGRIPAVVAFVLAALGLALYAVDADLVNFFVPMREAVLTLMLLSGGLLGLSLWRGGRSSLRLGLLAGVLLLAAVVYVREYTAYPEVELQFEREGATMAGTLYLPDAPGPHVAVVIAQGSIRAPRRIYHLFADRLVRSGLAVYSFDKRGTGASGGTYEADNNASAENLTLLAADVAAAVDAVRRHPEVDPAHVGVFGISMGGWLAPLATRRTDGIDFMVLVSGPPVSVGEEGYYSDLTGEGHSEGSGLAAAAIDSLVMARAPSGYDPRPLLREMTVPALWLFAGADSSVPTAKSVAVLDTLIQRDHRPYEYVVFPDTEHLGFSMSWPFDLAPGYWETITGWIDRQTRPCPPSTA